LHLILPRARYWAIISTWDRHGILDIGGMTARMGGIGMLTGWIWPFSHGVGLLSFLWGFP